MSMAYGLRNNCAKTFFCKQTSLIVEDVATCFLSGHRVEAVGDEISLPATE